MNCLWSVLKVSLGNDTHVSDVNQHDKLLVTVAQLPVCPTDGTEGLFLKFISYNI